MSAGQCPDCGELADAVLIVPVVGTGGPDVECGDVCVERNGASGGWRLYVHGGDPDGGR